VLRFFITYLTIVLALIILTGMLAPIGDDNTAPTGTEKLI